jgi:hypothetical protein
MLGLSNGVNSYSVIEVQRPDQKCLRLFYFWIPNGEINENVSGALFILLPLDFLARLSESKDRPFQILLFHHDIICIVSGY